MIHFPCQGCGRTFSVRDEYAGRRARCKACGASIVVPAVSAPVPTHAPTAADPAARVPMRIRRLMADAQQVQAAFSSGGVIQLRSMVGKPPEIYQVHYAVRSLSRSADGQPEYRDSHLVEIALTSDYPRLSPRCRMLTPIFHPNIDESAICVGDHWTAGERLVDLIVRIGEMLAYQAYNIKSPLDGEAAMWADLHHAQLPTDTRDLRPAGKEEL